ncbi:DUF1203 domain protein [Fusarium austroafricanum]|uniref:DUF1203 domain protein n=1 Tax=Fusarium austroafricanum TaxID=2364996 RepID=A0A8H4K9K2_9HYPO|nr:DUF1203 domain protein [Fusarium austroafricanum]
MSTEPPSQLRTGLQPVQLKYVPLSAPVSVSDSSTVTMTAPEGMHLPCRRCLLDATPGEVLHLIAYDPFPIDSVTPYRGNGPIFVHAHDCTPFSGATLPATQLKRLQSVRAYDENHMMVAAETVNGSEFEKVVGEMLADKKSSYVNVHNAKPGCFAVRVERA